MIVVMDVDVDVDVVRAVKCARSEDGGGKGAQRAVEDDRTQKWLEESSPVQGVVVLR